MWKPGTSPPPNSSGDRLQRKTRSRDEPPKQQQDVGLSDAHNHNEVRGENDPSSTTPPPPSSSISTSGGGGDGGGGSGGEKTSRKRLSGATLKMRFMKRTRDDSSTGRSHKSSGGVRSSGKGDANKSIVKNTQSSSSLDSNHNHSHRQQSNDNDNDDDDDDDVRMYQRTDESAYDDDDGPYGMATVVDMYGPEASVVGRRSFRGFNPAMEKAWNDSATLSRQSNHHHHHHRHK